MEHVQHGENAVERMCRGRTCSIEAVQCGGCPGGNTCSMNDMQRGSCAVGRVCSMNGMQHEGCAVWKACPMESGYLPSCTSSHMALSTHSPSLTENMWLWGCQGADFGTAELQKGLSLQEMLRRFNL